MRVVLAGGTGLIGRQLAAALRDAGMSVVVLTRSPATVKLGPGIEVAAWDGRRPGAWTARINGAHGVVNLVGESLFGRWSPAKKQLIRESRVWAGEALAAAINASAHPPAVLIQASAVGFYGTALQGTFTEADPSGSDFLASVCRDWEGSSSAVSGRTTRQVVARLGVVFSNAGLVLPRMTFPFRFFAGGPVSHGRQVLSWIHEADVVGALRLLLEQADASGPYNLTAPQPVTNREAAQAIGAVLHRPAFLSAPQLALRLLYGEMATLVLDGQRVLPRRLQSLGYEFRFPVIEAALNDLLL